MEIVRDYINIKIPIIRFNRDTQDAKHPLSHYAKPPYKVAVNVPVGSVVITKHGWDIGFVSETDHGRPAKILAYWNPSFPDFNDPQYGRVDLVDWYDTGVRMSLQEWKDLSKEKDIAEFHEYWEKRLHGGMYYPD